MSRNSTGNTGGNTGGSNRTHLPKSALAGAPGASGAGGTPMNRATRRLIIQAQQAAATGDARRAGQILATIPGLTGSNTPNTGGTSGGGQRQNQTQPQRQTQQGQQNQRPGRQLLDLINPTLALTPQQIAQLSRSVQGAQASRVEAVAFSVLLNAIRGMDLTVLTQAEIITLCQQTTLFGLAFTAMTAPGFAAAQTQQQTQQTGRQNQNQTQNQRQQNQPQPSASRRSRKNRNRAAVTA